MRLTLGLNGERLAKRAPAPFTGVGLIRAEYLCRLGGDFITAPHVRQGIASYCRALAGLFAPDPVCYRLLDMETSEANRFPSVDRVIEEKTTMLGLRGIRRALALPAAFCLEAEMLAEIGRSCANFHVLVPFVSSAAELAAALRTLRRAGFLNKVGLMAEIPSAVLRLDECIAAGAEFVTLGLNDLTSLTLGAARRTPQFDMSHQAVVQMVAMACEAASKTGVEISAAGDLSLNYLKTLEQFGCDAVVPFQLAAGSGNWDMQGMGAAIDTDEVLRSVRESIHLPSA